MANSANPDLGFFRSQLIWIYTLQRQGISGFSMTRVKEDLSTSYCEQKPAPSAQAELDFPLLAIEVLQYSDICTSIERPDCSADLYGKPFYYLLSKIDILYIISDILYRI